MQTPKAFAFCVLIAASVSAQGRLVVDDPLTGETTTDVRDNGPGQFVAGGWRVTGASDNIRYTPEIPIEAGAIEFDVTGLRFDDTREQNHRSQILSMYDASFGDPRHVYAPDVRLNPFKFVLQRNCRDEGSVLRQPSQAHHEHRRREPVRRLFVRRPVSVGRVENVPHAPRIERRADPFLHRRSRHRSVAVRLP